MKKILFICTHNVFRSRVAEILFNRMNKNKKYKAGSAGLIPWSKKDILIEPGFKAEKRAAKKLGINLTINSKPSTSSVLKSTDLAIIVADDVPKKVIEEERSFHGKIKVWKIPDVKPWDKNKEKIALNTIKFIDKKVRNFIKSLK